jgi:tRNA pseudouridine55 synthase
VYETVLHLGIVTDTQDATGKVLEEHISEVRSLSEDEVRQSILSFVGTYDQIPPMYSALKVNGKKLCDLARAGIEIERKARKVTVFSIEIREIALPLVTMRVHCSKGTYIRTLCNDIGRLLGVGGCMDSLVRTKVSVFPIEEALTLTEIEEYRDRGELDKILLPVDSVFEGLPQFHVRPEAFRFLQNGNHLTSGNFMEDTTAVQNDEQVRIYDPDDRFYAIYQYDHRIQEYKVRKMFGTGL